MESAGRGELPGLLRTEWGPIMAHRASGLKESSSEPVSSPASKFPRGASCRAVEDQVKRLQGLLFYDPSCKDSSLCPSSFCPSISFLGASGNILLVFQDSGSCLARSPAARTDPN